METYTPGMNLPLYYVVAHLLRTSLYREFLSIVHVEIPFVSRLRAWDACADTTYVIVSTD